MASRSANRLLAALPNGDLALLQPFLKEVVLETKQVIERPQQTIEQVHFVTRGQISVIATSPVNDPRVEVAMIGPEGMTGLPVVLGRPRDQRGDGAVGREVACACQPPAPHGHAGQSDAARNVAAVRARCSGASQPDGDA
ncbi:hypothetical protein [Reyranella sp.]|uniref:hypothetical protein n=1 Tax=Reyranella sp. TaxID=1929291 RepID=UPI00273007D7|nr:hypothetical protein [Reyranella sp.]MDP2375383.1 hypothetical protein [Reyranella sp.]